MVIKMGVKSLYKRKNFKKSMTNDFITNVVCPKKGCSKEIEDYIKLHSERNAQPTSYLH